MKVNRVLSREEVDDLVRKAGREPQMVEGDEVKFAISEINYDRQGNPIDKDGKLIIQKAEKMEDLTDEDFTVPSRSVELPQVPTVVDDAIGANRKPIIIKKNISRRICETMLTCPQNRAGIFCGQLFTILTYMVRTERRQNLITGLSSTRKMQVGKIVLCYWK